MMKQEVWQSHAPSALESDAELTFAAQHGDAHAYDLLFRRHYARLFHFALHLDGNRDNAEDIAQTAFVRAYQALPRMQNGQAFEKYLYRITINLVRDRARTARRKPWIGFLDLWKPSERRSEETEPVEFADLQLDPERQLVQDAFQAAVLQAIAALPLESRELLLLHHVQEFDIRQIADILKLPEGTVKSRLGRIRQRLRETLREWKEEEA